MKDIIMLPNKLHFFIVRSWEAMIDRRYYRVFTVLCLCFLFAACAGTPRHHLAIDASLIEPGQTQEDLLRMLGPPNASRTNQLGQEEWHYYEVRRHFWHKLPFSDRFSKPEVEALMVVLENGRVRSVQYYVPVPNR